jgi:hypothetical protein
LLLFLAATSPLFNFWFVKVIPVVQVAAVFAKSFRLTAWQFFVCLSVLISNRFASVFGFQ